MVVIEMVRSGWMWTEVESIGFIDELDVGCERRVIEDIFVSQDKLGCVVATKSSSISEA